MCKGVAHILGFELNLTPQTSGLDALRPPPPGRVPGIPRSVWGAPRFWTAWESAASFATPGRYLQDPREPRGRSYAPQSPSSQAHGGSAGDSWCPSKRVPLGNRARPSKTRASPLVRKGAPNSPKTTQGQPPPSTGYADSATSSRWGRGQQKGSRSLAQPNGGVENILPGQGPQSTRGHRG